MKAVCPEDECLYICYVWTERISGVVIVDMPQGTCLLYQLAVRWGSLEQVPKEWDMGKGDERELGTKKCSAIRLYLRAWETTRSQGEWAL